MTGRSVSNTYREVEVEFLMRRRDAVLLSANETSNWVPRSLLHWDDDTIIDHLVRGEIRKLRIMDWKVRQTGWLNTQSQPGLPLGEVNR